MKKVIIIEISLILVCATLIAVAVDFWAAVSRLLKYKNLLYSTDFLTQIRYCSTYGTICLIAIVLDIVAMVLIAILNFKCFKPILDKLAAKKAKAKQARIEQLQAELDELKKKDI